MSPLPDLSGEDLPHNHPPRSDASDPIGELVNAYYADVYRFAFRLAGNPPDAEDLVQQTFLTACRKLHQIKDLEKVRAWLFTIAKNAFLKSKQRSTVDVQSFEDALATMDEPDQLNLEFDEEALSLALAEMPEPFKTPILLYYFEGFGYKEIAEQLEIPIGTVMSRLSRGKRFLRCRLSNPSETISAEQVTDPEVED